MPVSMAARATIFGMCLLATSSLARPVHAATPDISGPWVIAQTRGALRVDGGGAPPLRQAAQAQYDQLTSNKAAAAKTDPMATCLPPGVPRLLLQNRPFNIVQGHTMYAMMFEWNHLNRIIHLTDAHGETIGPLYLGHSIGHWDGDTLVVDTISYNDKTWLDDTGLPHSDQLHTIEHMKLLDGGSRLQDQVTIDDPKTYAATWTTTLTFRKQPDAIIEEDYCLGRLGKNKLEIRK